MFIYNSQTKFSLYNSGKINHIHNVMRSSLLIYNVQIEFRSINLEPVYYANAIRPYAQINCRLSFGINVIVYYCIWYVGKS